MYRPCWVTVEGSVDLTMSMMLSGKSLNTFSAFCMHRMTNETACMFTILALETVKPEFIVANHAKGEKNTDH